MKTKKGMKREKAEKRNNYSVKAGIGTLAILAGLIGLLLAGNMLFPFRRGQMPEGGIPVEFLAGTFMSVAMLVLSAYLIFIYLKDYLELKSHFTLGILMAVISFMMFALTTNPLFHVFFGIYGRPGLFSLVPYVFATVSLAILAWISSK